ncbi:MAG: hypothetical protein AAGC72_00405 [Planctomycetota bacterium]
MLHPLSLGSVTDFHIQLDLVHPITDFHIFCLEGLGLDLLQQPEIEKLLLLASESR